MTKITLNRIYKNIIKNQMNYLRQLASKSIGTLIVIGSIFMLYAFIMQFLDHSSPWIIFMIVTFALVKVAFFTFFTLRQMQTALNYCTSIGQILFIFGLLIVLISFSFATDYFCLSMFDKQAFKGLSNDINTSFWHQLYDYFYLSVVTFTSLGFGDIVPVSVTAKSLVILQACQSYLLFVFGISNIKTIHQKLN